MVLKGPAPDLERTHGCKKTAATTPVGHPPAFHASWVTAQVILTWTMLPWVSYAIWPEAMELVESNLSALS